MNKFFSDHLSWHELIVFEKHIFAEHGDIGSRGFSLTSFSGLSSCFARFNSTADSMSRNWVANLRPFVELHADRELLGNDQLLHLIVSSVDHDISSLCFVSDLPEVCSSKVFGHNTVRRITIESNAVH